MKVCVISFKDCWQEADGQWVSYGGFPAQMAAVGSLFDEMTLVITRGQPRQGGIRLPEQARVIGLRNPKGADARRKLDVMLYLPYYLWNIVRYSRAADAIHVPLPNDISFLGMLVAVLLRKRLLARYCSSWPSTDQESFMNRVTKSLMRRWAGGRNVMLATGLGTTAPAPAMHWIFASAIDQDEVTTLKPDLARVPEGVPTFAYLGRLSPEKGVKTLVEAWGLLVGTLGAGTPHLTLIGDGPQRSELAAWVERTGCQEFVHFAGQLNRADLMACLLHTDVCVLPSLTESLGKARLEALLCGVPLITTEVGFGRDIVGSDGERGWIVPVADSKALADTVHLILTTAPDWPLLRQRCRRFAETFTLQVWADRIGQLCADQWHLVLVEGKLTRGFIPSP